MGTILPRHRVHQRLRPGNQHSVAAESLNAEAHGHAASAPDSEGIEIKGSIHYGENMSPRGAQSTSDARLYELAEILRTAFSLTADLDTGLADILFALDNPEMREIYVEIRALQEEQLVRIERLLGRHIANDR